MRTLRALWRLLRAVLHALHGLAIVQWRLASLGRAERHARIRWWSDKMLRVLGMKQVVHGQFKPGPKLLVANHVSWIDIMAVHAVCPEARFVSKADVQHWPLIGRLVAAAETLYIERERRRDALRVVHQMADAMKAGDTVAVFPEGTTSDGHGLLPFHANLLQAAIATATPVQPLALRYSDCESAVSPAAAYIGDTSLAQSLWMLACADGMVVHVAVQPPSAIEHADRRRLAQRLQDEIAAALTRLGTR